MVFQPVLWLILGLILSIAVQGESSVGSDSAANEHYPVSIEPTRQSDRERELDSGSTQNATEKLVWKRNLPVFGQKRAKRGYQTRLPFGISLTVLNLDRKMAVEEIKAGLVGTDLRSVDDILAVDVKLDVLNVTSRFDVWIFPFLNVYGLAGNTESSNTVDVRFSLPGRLPFEVEFEDDFDTNGGTYGGGLILAWGHKQLFTVVDANRTHTDLGSLAGKVDATIVSLRGG